MTPARWLENTSGGTVQPPEKVAKTTGLAAQLRLQWDAAKRLKDERERNGALELETIEATPVAKDGRVVDLTLDAQERGARSDRGFHDRVERRDREVARGARPLGHSPHRA